MNKGGKHETVFVNPYNFIPISKNAPMRAPMHAAGQGESKDGRLTGVIEYSVLTKTPLFIPNTSNKDGLGMGIEDHHSYDFFTYTDLSGAAGPAADAMPVIPGSEIRGMFRSNYEILTNSCMSAVDDDVTLSKRTNQVFDAGLIRKNEDGSYDLFKAQDCLVRTTDRRYWKEGALWEDDTEWRDDEHHNNRRCYKMISLKEGSEVDVYVDKRNGVGKALALMPAAKDSKDTEKGYIIKGEDGPVLKDKKTNTTKRGQKHCCHVFVLKIEHDKPQTVSENISLATLNAVLKAYEDNGEHLYREYSSQLSLFQQGKSGGEYFPVYYSCETPGYEDGQAKGKRLMLSPACITREIYGRKIKDMIGEHRSCSSGDSLCPACALFGTVGRNERGQNFSRASRIRFADLVCDENSPSECFMDTVTLEPLSSPKLNNMEFYLERPADDAVFWTYDYYIDEKGSIHRNEAGLNGRKFYWHNLHPKMESVEATSQNMTIRPLRKGIVFDGKLNFQDLSRTELNQLIFLLDAGEPGGKTTLQAKRHGYKLGSAKPLGLGSIAVSVNQVKILSFEKKIEERKVERREILYNQYEQPDFDTAILADFNRMTNFYEAEGDGREICYPYEVDQGQKVIFGWFVNNHVKKNKDGTYDKKKMPNSRKQMAYEMYLEAMNPLLRSTKMQGERKESVSDRREAGKPKSTGKAFVPGKIYTAKVTGIEPQKYIQIEVENDKYREEDCRIIIEPGIANGDENLKWKYHLNQVIKVRSAKRKGSVFYFDLAKKQD